MKARKEPRAREASGKGVYFCVGALAALGAVSGGLAVAVGVLLLPCLLVGCLEREPGVPMMRAMAMFGMAPGINLLARLWSGGADVGSGLAMVVDPIVIGESWAAQGGAWLMAEVLPAVLVLRMELGVRRDLAALQVARRDLEEEWAAS